MYSENSSPKTPLLRYLLSITLSVAVWYGSSYLYVEQAQRNKGGDVLETHMFVHGCYFFAFTAVWELMESGSLPSLRTFPFPFPFAAVCHGAGTAFALFGIFRIGGSGTQLLKLLEPVLVLCLRSIIGKKCYFFDWRRLAGTLLVLYAVARWGSGAHSYASLAIGFCIVIWYPMRNVLVTKGNRGIMSLWFMVLSSIPYIFRCILSRDVQLPSFSAHFVGILFAVYQVASLWVLHVVGVQTHAALNVLKRAVVIIALAILFDRASLPAIRIYLVAVAGSCFMSVPDIFQSSGVFRSSAKPAPERDEDLSSSHPIAEK